MFGNLSVNKGFLVSFSVVLFLALAMVISSMFIRPNEAFAGPGTPFGGPVYSSIYCDCTNNTLFFVLDYKNRNQNMLALLATPGETREYEFYGLNAGEFFLGLWERGGRCEVETSYGCVRIHSDGTMKHVGSSGGTY